MLEAKLAEAPQTGGPEAKPDLAEAGARQTALEAKIAELEGAVARAEERRESEAAVADQAALEAKITDLNAPLLPQKNGARRKRRMPPTISRTAARSSRLAWRT